MTQDQVFELLKPYLARAYAQGRAAGLAEFDSPARTFAADSDDSPHFRAAFSATDVSRYADYFASDNDAYPGTLHRHFGMSLREFADATQMQRKQVQFADGKTGWQWVKRAAVNGAGNAFSDTDDADDVFAEDFASFADRKDGDTWETNGRYYQRAGGKTKRLRNPNAEQVDAAKREKSEAYKKQSGGLTPKEVLQKQKADAEPKREEARAAWAAAVANPQTVGAKEAPKLAEALHTLTRDEAREMLRAAKEKVGGLKSELVQRMLKKLGVPSDDERRATLEQRIAEQGLTGDAADALRRAAGAKEVKELESESRQEPTKEQTVDATVQRRLREAIGLLEGRGWTPDEVMRHLRSTTTLGPRPLAQISDEITARHLEREGKTWAAQRAPIAEPGVTAQPKPANELVQVPEVTPAATPISQADDAAFAKKVQQAADDHTHGFGPDKAYISDVYDSLKAEDPTLTREEFDRRLFEAGRTGALEMSRADLVQLMDPDVVNRSNVKHPSGSGEFHFIRGANKQREQRGRKQEEEAATAAGVNSAWAKTGQDRIRELTGGRAADPGMLADTLRNYARNDAMLGTPTGQEVDRLAREHIAKLSPEQQSQLADLARADARHTGEIPPALREMVERHEPTAYKRAREGALERLKKIPGLSPEQQAEYAARISAANGDSESAVLDAAYGVTTEALRASKAAQQPKAPEPIAQPAPTEKRVPKSPGALPDVASLAKKPLGDKQHLESLAAAAPNGDAREYLANAAHNARGDKISMSPEDRRHNTIERLAAEHRNALADGKPDAAAHIADVVKQFGGTLKDQAGAEIRHDGLYYDAPEGVTTDTPVRVVRPAITGPDGRVAVKGEVAPGTTEKPATRPQRVSLPGKSGLEVSTGQFDPDKSYAGPDGKEPWQMNSKDWESAVDAVRGSGIGGGAGPAVGSQRAKAAHGQEQARTADLERLRMGLGSIHDPDGILAPQRVTHEAVIAAAIAAGKPVPADVLADYPDLAAKSGRVAAPAAAPAKTQEQIAAEITAKRRAKGPRSGADDAKPTAAEVEAASQPATPVAPVGGGSNNPPVPPTGGGGSSVNVADVYKRSRTDAKHSEMNSAMRAVAAMSKKDAAQALRSMRFPIGSNEDGRVILAQMIYDGGQVAARQSFGMPEDSPATREAKTAAYTAKNDEPLLNPRDLLAKPKPKP